MVAELRAALLEEGAGKKGRIQETQLKCQEPGARRKEGEGFVLMTYGPALFLKCINVYVLCCSRKDVGFWYLAGAQ